MSDAAVIPSIVQAVQDRLSGIVAAGASKTWAQVPAYAASPDPALRRDLAVHIDAVFRTVLETMLQGRAAERSDFPVTAAQARRRFEQGVSLADFLRAFRINQVVLWQNVVEAAGPEPGRRDAALHLATHVMQVIEVGSSVAADAYVQAQQLELAEGDRLERDLMEDLLAGRVPQAGRKHDVLAAVGLAPAEDFLLTTAAPPRPAPGGPGLRDAVSALRAVLGGRRRGVVVLRQDEIVGIAALAGATAAGMVAEVERVHQRLARQGIALTVGISTVQTGLDQIPYAYEEAVFACSAGRDAAAVVALPTMSTFDYLMLRNDPTALRLIRPELRRFLDEDRSAGGELTRTLEAYVASDLNGKVAAAALHVHANTAYYRLERIAERTGRDLRRFDHVMELLIAIRLLSHPSAT